MSQWYYISWSKAKSKPRKIHMYILHAKKTPAFQRSHPSLSPILSSPSFQLFSHVSQETEEIRKDRSKLLPFRRSFVSRWFVCFGKWRRSGSLGFWVRRPSRCRTFSGRGRIAINQWIIVVCRSSLWSKRFEFCNHSFSWFWSLWVNMSVQSRPESMYEALVAFVVGKYEFPRTRDILGYIGGGFRILLDLVSPFCNRFMA